MRIEAAHIDQIRRARDGRMLAISKDAGGVAEDLARIDKGLKVRFAEAGRPPYWAVYWESEDQRDTYLVTTAQAFQNHAGVWEGLDQRIVRHVERLDPHGRGGIDYAREVQRMNEAAEEAKREAARERFAGFGEMAAHAIRRDLGGTSRAVVPRDLPPAA